MGDWPVDAEDGLLAMIYFTADTHFGHERTLKLSRRPFDSVDKMNAAIVARWQLTVKPEDTVYHLGDFGDPSFIELLSGKIYFLPGNYDDEKTVKALDEQCHIISPNLIVELEQFKLQLIHEPDEAIDTGLFFLFGHIHNLQMVKRNGLNVGVDCHNFTPISLDTVTFYKQAIELHYDENVFIPVLGVTNA